MIGLFATLDGVFLLAFVPVQKHWYKILAYQFLPIQIIIKCYGIKKKDEASE